MTNALASVLVLLLETSLPAKKPQCIWVLRHHVYHVGVASVEVVVPCWGVSIDGLVWRREIGDDIDISVLQLLHAVVVTLVRVDGVYSNDVCVELFQVWNVSSAVVTVAQRVNICASSAIATSADARAIARVVL